MLKSFRIPISWTELIKRTGNEVLADNCFGLAAQLAFYFFLALFPALLFVVAIVSFIPIEGLIESITASLSRVAPYEVLALVKDQIAKIANDKASGLLTLGMLGTIWSTSSGVSAIIDTLNQAYDIQENRPWWKVKLVALGLTVALAMFIVSSFALVLVGPAVAQKIATYAHVGGAFTLAWMVVQWPLVFGLVAVGIALVYYYAPDAEQEWIWLTPGSVVATVLWVLISLGFKFYVANFASYNATYGAIGGVIVTMLWFYVSSLAVLLGAELNAEIEHASPYGKDPGEKTLGAKKKIGALAERAWAREQAGTLEPASVARPNCDVDQDLPPAMPPPPPRARLSDWILGGVALVEAAIVAYSRLRNRSPKIRV
jgi:membrane protein